MGTHGYFPISKNSWEIMIICPKHMKFCGHYSFHFDNAMVVIHPTSSS